MADRPNAAVTSAVHKFAGNRALTKNFKVTILESPEAIRSADGCRWTETMQYMYSHVRNDGVSQACTVWDDDIVLSDTALEEMSALLDHLPHDRVEALWIHAIDEDCEEHDIGFPPHRATFLFRVYPDDDWSDVLTRTIIGGGTHSPIFVARSPNVGSMDGRVLHMGYASEDAREYAWNQARQSGQVCPFFRTLSRPPAPQRATGPSETSTDLAQLRETS